MRHIHAALLVPATLALVACKRDEGRTANVTTIRSATPEGIAETSGPRGERAAESEAAALEPAERLTRAICAHMHECSRARGDGGTVVPEHDEAACIDDIRPIAREAMKRIDCSPAVAQAGFHECLAAINTQRCYEMTEQAPVVAECRPSAICREGEGISRQ